MAFDQNALDSLRIERNNEPGSSGPLLKPGPFVAETFPITVEDQYIAVTLPGRARRRDSSAASGP